MLYNTLWMQSPKYFFRGTLLGFFLLFFWSCSPENPEPDAGNKCSTSHDCAKNERCRIGKCVEVTNREPIAEAGTNQKVKINEKVFLDGKNSFDPDGDKLTYSWSFKSKPAQSKATLENPTSGEPSFVADKLGNFLVKLEVSDGKSKIQDEVLIQVEKGINHPPKAVVGENQSVEIGATVQLDGSKSSDSDGDTLTYKWILKAPTNSQAKLIDEGTAKPSFIADTKGEFQLSLIVNDGEEDSLPASLKVIAIKDFDKEPSITRLDPNKVPAASISELNIYGKQLAEGAVVIFRSRELSSTYVSASQLKVSLDLISVPVGKYPISVKNPNGKQSKTIDLEVFLVPKPKITAFQPNKAGAGANFKLVIEGSSFVKGAKTFFTGTELKTTFISSVKLEAMLNLTGISIGFYPITVRNPGGKTSDPVQFEVTVPPPPPEITLINPEQGKSSEKIDFSVAKN